MIMTEPSRKRRSAVVKRLTDVQQGEFVRRKGLKGVGLVETVEHGFAWVAWKDGRKDYLPLMMLRRVKAGGREYDARDE